MKRRLGALVFVAALIAAVPAVAQEVVSLNEEGITAFSEGRFEEAATKFSQAYAIKPEPPLKKNEALAWFKANKCSEALAAAKEYLALGVEDELSTKEAQTVAVRCYIQRAEGELASGNSDAMTAAIADARANSPTPEDEQRLVQLETDLQAKVAADEAERQRAAAAAAEAAEKQRQEDAAAARGGSKMVGLGIAAGGGAIVVGTLVYHLAMALGTAPKFKDAAAAGDRGTYDKLGKRLETANWLVPTLYGLGLVTTGVGAYLWWNAGGLESDPQTTASRTRIESAGVTFSWSF